MSTQWYYKEGRYDSRLAPTNCTIKSSQDGVICIWGICMFCNWIFLIVFCKNIRCKNLQFNHSMISFNIKRSFSLNDQSLPGIK